MDHNELSYSGGFEANDTGLAYRAEERQVRVWQPAENLRQKVGDGPYAVELASSATSIGARALAIECDGSTGMDFDLAELWRRLGAGRWTVRDAFATACRLYVVVEESGGEGPPATNDAGLAMIEQIVLGQSSKAVAIDRQVTGSTVALAIKRRLRQMGLTCKVRALPLILAMAARAACRGPRGVVLGRIALLSGEALKRSWVVSVSHPDVSFPELLSDAEQAVLHHVLQGRSYVQIAAARETLLRTVANQLSAVFRKLGVSGYGQTLDLLLSRTFGATAGTQPEERARHASFRSHPSPAERVAPPAH